jgi:hypothetical protein
MTQPEFIEKLKEFSDDIGADVFLNLKNQAGSPMSGRRLVNASEKLLTDCQIVSVTIVPKLVKEEPTDGEASIPVDSGEV